MTSLVAPAGQRRRTDQPGSLDLVSPGHRRRALSHRRYLVADRNRRHRHVTGARASLATKPGSCTLPLPGMDVDIVDDDGNSVTRPEQGGSLVIRRPWPSMLRTIWNDNARYIDTYWSKFQNRYYVAGDSAHRDADGYFWIMGRADDVLKISGHRLGTMEIESALVAHPRVAEAAVVGRPHDIKGESVFAFVVCRGERPRGDTRCAGGGTASVGERAGGRAGQAGRHPLCRQPARRPARERSCVDCCATSRATSRSPKTSRRWRIPRIVDQLRGLE